MRRVLWTILILSSLLYVGCSSSTESSKVAAPVIKEDLNATYTATEGGIFNLFIDAAGESITYKWQQVTLDANNTVTGATDVADETADTLAISALTANNNTNYRCIVTNEGGSDTSNIAKLIVTVNIDAPKIQEDISSLLGKAGESFVFQINALGQNLEYVWEEVVLDDQGEVTSATVIPNQTLPSLAGIFSTEIDGKSYRCIVKNGAGSDTSSIATITLYKAPEISTKYPSVAGFDNTTYSIQIDAEGLNISYQWQEVVLDAQGIVTSAIDLMNTTNTITGTISATTNGKKYRCIVTNEIGSDTSAIASINLLTITSMDLLPYKATNATKSSRPAVMKTVGNKLYVGLQKLNDDWTATETSIVLVINTLDNTVIDTIVTTGFNIGDMEVVGNYLYIVNTGSLYAHGDGQVERISLLDHSIEMVFKSTVDISNIEHYTGDQFFVSSYSYDMTNFKGVTPVYVCDFTTDLFSDTVVGVENGTNLLYDAEEGLLYIGEAHGATRGEVKVYNPITKVVTAIPTTLGVSSMKFYRTGADKRIVLTESDYVTGYLGEIKGGVYTQKLVINSDAQVEVADEHLFVLEKYGADNLMKVNPSTYAVLYQQALTDKYNPYAVEIINGIGYVLSYELSTLNTFDITTGVLK